MREHLARHLHDFLTGLSDRDVQLVSRILIATAAGLWLPTWAQQAGELLAAVTPTAR